MACPFTGLSEISTETIKPTLRPDPIVGTKVHLYDENFIWTSEHLSPTVLNQWRNEGDPVIDHFFEIYGEQLQNNEDTYQFLEQLHQQEKDHICNEFCEEICLINFVKNIRQKPTWFDKDKIQRGQEFFMKRGPMICGTIFSYSLILGYGFQQLNDVLMKTQYLSSPDLAETFHRLVETLQMVIHSNTGDVDNFNETFLDVVRVRLLHGMVRYKIKKYSRFNLHQVPINQEDTLVTLLGFSFGVLKCMEERMNISLSMEDKNNYLHLWRYIGWIIGIKDEYLYYLSSYNSSRIIAESILYHFYLPSQTSKHLVHHAIMAVYKNFPLPLSFDFFRGFSQILLGEQVSEALEIDQPKLGVFTSYMLNIVVQLYRLGCWIISLDIKVFNQWLIKRHKQTLREFLDINLNNQLRNFSLYKNFQWRRNGDHATSLKDCPCGYYEKKRNGKAKTNDIGLLQFEKAFSKSFLLQIIILIFFCILILIRLM